MYLAHIASDGREQTVKQHLEATAERAAAFADGFGMAEDAAYIGLLHDIGKYSAAFQRRLHGGPKVDHSTAGAYEAMKNRKPAAAFCIAGHHSGLPDGGTGDVEGTTLVARIGRAENGELPVYEQWKTEIQPKEFRSCQSYDKPTFFFQTKMLYSCLVDADYLDTEAFMNGTVDRSRAFSIEKLEQALDAYIKDWFPPKTELNRLRCEILEQVMQAGKENEKGLFSLTVPTGGGKTIASLAFAIRHARANGFQRIIYVIPYTSIIEQTAEIFLSIFGEEQVLEHHSGVELTDDEDSLLYLRAAENWDIPIIVTTAVQFFESFYKNKSSSSRKLHNIANSVVVFDEAQMLPIPVLRPCVRLITELVKNYGVSAVLCTATQPALLPIINEFLPDAQVKELCPKHIFENQAFTRVTYQNRGTLTDEELAEELNSKQQVLCIVNRRQAAQTLYQRLDEEGSYHLSTMLYPAHRKRLLDEIRKRLVDGLPCRVVSTSLVEAGVDVDFPLVYRQIAGLDSILQAGGRCNREGKRSREDSIVTIFDLECGSPELFSMQISAGKKAMEQFENIAGKEAVQAYFEQLFYLKGKENLDQQQILQQIQSGTFPFAEIAKDFHMLEENTRALYIPAAENEKEIRALKYGAADRQAYRKLNLYSVNIYEKQFENLVKQHAVEMLENGACILVDSSRYSDKLGLLMEPESGQVLFL